jgi:CHAD domain-containing protein
LTKKVRKRSKRIDGDPDVDAVHDMRTTTRRLRTAIKIYGEVADKADRKAVERELRRVARRLGTVRDLDVLLESLEAAGKERGGAIDTADLEPLRDAWQEERQAGAKRLQAEIDRLRFVHALDSAKRLVQSPHQETGEGQSEVVHRIADRAPALIWAAFGKLRAQEIDPLTADPAAIHEMRIEAKKLRYRLEAFENALEPGTTLIEQVKALQDAGGEMHDAIVASDRARSAIDTMDLDGHERAAINAFVTAQDRRAEMQRPIVARCPATVRGRAFRESLGRAVAGMGHITAGTPSASQA